ncbi:hypothetical protein ABZ499_33110 [Streptomyces sp. NPDC019990]|uniref:hypothetical protein n=1 Tax=Streptomyces sp. NPDC019990 TaxID=3154693 RepID=UPI00340BA545
MMTAEDAAQLIHEALAAAVAGDGDRAADLVARLGVDSDAARMLGVCYAFAEAGHKALKKLFGDQAPNPQHGDYWMIQQLGPGALDNPAQGFASRFLVAYCNGDRDTARAHWETALQAGPEAFIGGVCQLLIDVAGLARAVIQQSEAEGG